MHRARLNELFAREFHNRRAIAHRIEKSVVLFRRDARKGLEPVREMRGAMLEAHSFMPWATAFATSRSSGLPSFTVSESFLYTSEGKYSFMT